MLSLIKSDFKIISNILLLVCIILIGTNSSFCQLQLVTVDSIIIEGNNHTKRSVILRELEFNIGDTLEMFLINESIVRSEKRLLSTGLFNLADINIKSWDEQFHQIVLSVSLQENWYIYPAPIFELADRNFNVWWTEQNASFDRVNYGLRFDHLNLTGHKDPAKLVFQTGYTRKYEIDYQYPYFFGSWGIGGNVLFTENKEIGYSTFGNKILFTKLSGEPVLLQRFRATANVYRRNSAFLYQSFQLQYHHRSINDSIANFYNPNYLLEGKNSMNYLALEYDVKYDKRIFPTYPEGGYLLQANIRKEGLGIGDPYNNFSISVIAEQHFNVYKGLYWGIRMKAKTNISSQRIPFSLNNGLGYGGDRVRGYEYYVIDGTDFLLAKSSWRYKLLDKKYNISDVMKLRAFRIIPITIYARLTTDVGKVWDSNTDIIDNPLSKKLLVGYGPALDILLYNNYVFSIEYTFNKMGEKGIYFESSFNF